VPGLKKEFHCLQAFVPVTLPGAAVQPAPLPDQRADSVSYSPGSKAQRKSPSTHHTSGTGKGGYRHPMASAKQIQSQLGSHLKFSATWDFQGGM